MFGILLKNCVRQVVIIPKKLKNISEISTMLQLNYWTKIWTKIIQDNKSKAEWTKNDKDKKTEGIDNPDNKKK